MNWASPLLWSTCESDVLSLSTVLAGGWSAWVIHLISCSSLNCCMHSSAPQLLSYELADSRWPIFWRQCAKTNREKRKSRALGTAVGTGWISTDKFSFVMTGLFLGTSHCSSFPKPVLCLRADFSFVHQQSPIQLGTHGITVHGEYGLWTQDRRAALLTCGHWPPDNARLVISVTVFFRESGSWRETDTGWRELRIAVKEIKLFICLILALRKHWGSRLPWTLLFSY